MSDSSVRQGPLDERKLSSRSPFRSGYFLVVTSLCLGGALYGFSILYRFWPRLSSQGTAGLLIFVCGFVYPWWKTLRYHDRMRELYLEGSVTEVEQGSPLGVALESAAGAIHDSLFYCFVTMLALLAYIEHLLRVCR